MTPQLALPFPLDDLRVEIPSGDGSRRTADGLVVRWRVFAHSVDHAWSWWRPGRGWGDRP
jgi:hypothetical protein